MDLVLRSGRVLYEEPGGRFVDSACDIRVADGVIVEIGRGLTGHRVVQLGDRWILPGLIDLHVHFREPGFEGKEDIATGMAAAAAGGFTAVCAMPNTKPVNDCRLVTETMVRRAAEVGLIRVHPIGAITKGQAGESLAEMAQMVAAGAVAVSDDGRPVMNAGLLRRAMEYARSIGIPVIQHAEDDHLVEGGVMNEGEVATRLGLPGQSPCAESAMVARDLEIAEWTGARYHVAHVSTGRTVDLIRNAKRRGVAVTCEVTPHHLVLTDEACNGYDTRARCNPPLRAGADKAALIAGLAEGVIDAIATDHAPHGAGDKQTEFACAAPGLLGLQTALPLVLDVWRSHGVPLSRIVRALTLGPAAALGLEGGTLAIGAAADLAIVDPDQTWRWDAATNRSKSQNSPWFDLPLRGRAVATLVAGSAVYDVEGLL